MKKLLFIFFAAVLLLSACKKDEEKTGTIVGTLQFESGEVIPFTLVLLKSDNITIQQAFTDDKGYFSFTDIPFGDYELLSNHDEYKTSKPVAISITDENALLFDFIFTPIVSLQGKVLIGNYPYPANKIELFDNHKVDIKGETYLDLESSFEFYDLEPGVYYLKLTVTQDHIYEVYGYLWNGSTWVWGPFDIESFSFQDVYYPIEIEQDLTREVVLNITWSGSGFVVNE
ncbi:MAG TPA: hypothetical protein DCQ26_06690 [Marinilabiliales bacterium]|nr:MAG: hypothetical protein A2W95_19490 [Bacteroidetes bacterium GWA2_40_14]OFX59101.1 MAG: hypothetical protein A2W84_10350 [Bacteroidetes bacterium GWC2_40_13]OFX74198.1 MAG: hypothetical protein A2W96_12915 [Bacteroidetes bacterium GWD2_40_43]OFX92968.1 MAG: hypothetical protein A2W97_05160 [Bacteroidetes bacterium GWE2_40_63]OFY21337.1 MAG: hypothetical protein A2W88_09155 [Bacteroidetes bacterium GWF2_40_13]OFZ30965.1 MAG: hypothetical protein A2437_15170 [Bacteroidetes bacterium RIFOXYC